jgi:peptide/nickel transport system permease protein
MVRFILKRLVHAMVSLLVITVIVFSLSHLSGNPIDSMLPNDASPQQIEDMTRHLGLDRPVWVQYLTFL